MLNVLVAEDSPTQRQLLLHVLGTDPEIHVVGQATDGAEAVSMAIQQHPDVIVMDIQMPGVDGYEATKRIMREAPTPILIVTSNYDPRELEVSLQALRAGAIHVVPKPVGPQEPDFEREAAQFLRALRAVARVKNSQAFPRGPVEAPPRSAKRVKVVAFAASTGGPAALYRIFSQLPATFPAPILVVQHIARGFVEGFAAWLNSASLLTIHVAEHGEPLQAGHVYLAPDDRHLEVLNKRIHLSDAPAVEGFRPSASRLFASVAAEYRSASAAVVLTGMGQDGVAGLRDVRSSGGQVIAQNEATSVVFGMPGAVIAAGLADQVIPLPELPDYLMRIC